ncbi:hypothetical protein AHiyo8_pI68010 (plasmid) [Arthrobacter sp. Hiyo8]|nr:hypothetical protein AHiyo8_pI68010 [Arthrobacter sp. Hiyo8]
MAVHGGAEPISALDLESAVTGKTSSASREVRVSGNSIISGKEQGREI